MQQAPSINIPGLKSLKSYKAARLLQTCVSRRSKGLFWAASLCHWAWILVLDNYDLQNCVNSRGEGLLWADFLWHCSLTLGLNNAIEHCHWILALDNFELQNCVNRREEVLLWADLLRHRPWEMQRTPSINIPGPVDNPIRENHFKIQQNIISTITMENLCQIGSLITLKISGTRIRLKFPLAIAITKVFVSILIIWKLTKLNQIRVISAMASDSIQGAMSINLAMSSK